MFELLPELYSRSQRLVLNFSKIPSSTPTDENIQLFFEELLKRGENPASPANRQKFNNSVLDKTGKRYLVSSYAEDRSAMLRDSHILSEGRVYHLGVDIFSRDLETVFSPCDGEIVRIGNEPENHSFGHFILIRPADTSVPYIFLGHLAEPNIAPGRVKAGQAIGKLGDFINHDNGGWSRHLHVQIMKELPADGAGLIGYSTKDGLEASAIDYPDPVLFFKELKTVLD